MKITVCGSIAFYTEMESIRDRLIELGHEVKIPELALEVPKEYGGGKKVHFGTYIDQNGGIDAFHPSHKIWDLKRNAIRDHFEKIEWCDSILVLNPDKRGIQGYVGGNTLIEIGLAFYLRKGIFIMNEVSPQLTYKQEILGMGPTILKGDLSMVK